MHIDIQQLCGFDSVMWGLRNGCKWMWDLMLVLKGFEEWIWGRLYRLTDSITKYCIFIKNIPHFFK
jgi:hypothetical protein